MQPSHTPISLSSRRMAKPEEPSPSVLDKAITRYNFKFTSQNGRLLCVNAPDYSEERTPDGRSKTIRAMAFTRAKMKFMLPELVAKPRNALPPDLDIVDPTSGRARVPSRRNKKPVTMYFGLGITVHQMSFYGHQEKLKTHHEVGQHLAKRFKAHPRLTAPVVTCEIVSNMDYDLVIALYSNYTRYDREVSEEREKHILKWVGKQFGIVEKECVGMWYEEDAHMKNSLLTDGLVWVEGYDPRCKRTEVA